MFVMSILLVEFVYVCVRDDFLYYVYSDLCDKFVLHCVQIWCEGWQQTQLKHDFSEEYCQKEKAT